MSLISIKAIIKKIFLSVNKFLVFLINNYLFMIVFYYSLFYISLPFNILLYMTPYIYDILSYLYQYKMIIFYYILFLLIAIVNISIFEWKFFLNILFNIMAYIDQYKNFIYLLLAIGMVCFKKMNFIKIMKNRYDELVLKSCNSNENFIFYSITFINHLSLLMILFGVIFVFSINVLKTNFSNFTFFYNK